MNHYRRPVDAHSPLSPAQRAVAGMVSVARDALIKQAYSMDIGKRFASVAHHDPMRALSHLHALDRGLRGAVGGAIAGGIGGALVAGPPLPPQLDAWGQPQEQPLLSNPALRGALLGGLGGGLHGAFAGRRDFGKMLNNPASAANLQQRADALRAAGAPLYAAFTR